MSDVPVDPRWSKILSLSVHEFRTPLTVVGGYIRMLLKERAGPVSDQQRKLLEEAEKGSARISALLVELSELSNLEAGTAPFNKQTTDLHKALRTAVEQLPAQPEGAVAIPVELQLEGDAAPMQGDPVRLTQAFTSVIKSLRRELFGELPLIVRQRQPTAGGYDVHIGDTETLAALDAEGPGARTVFNEWRGGSGLILPVARRLIEAHGGRMWDAPAGRTAGARIEFRPLL